MDGLCIPDATGRWLEYFPDEWHRNLSERDTDIRWHFDFWGQFISAKGTLNKKYADQLRATGNFLFYPRSSECSFAVLREHLKSL